MAKLRLVGTPLLLSFAMGGGAIAQGAMPINHREVVGEWTLAITPAQRQDMSITFKAKDGSQRLEFPLAIASQANGRLICAVDGRPAECRIRDGGLVVVSGDSGVRMTFTLTDRTRAGFSGGVGMRVRLLPISGHIGSVNMTRRP